MPIKHKKVSAAVDSGDSTLIQGPDWNEDHHVQFVVIDDATTLTSASSQFVYCDTSTSSVITVDPNFADVRFLFPFETGVRDVKNRKFSLFGGATINTSMQPPPYGQQCLVTGYNNRLEFDPSSLVLLNDFTFECWVRPAWSDLDSGIHEFYVNRSGSGGTPVNLGINNGGQPFVWYGTTYISTGTPLVEGQVYHLAYQRNGTVTRVFKDGVLWASATTGSGTLGITNGASTLAGDNVAGQHFSGSMKDARLTAMARYSTSGFTPPVDFLPQVATALELTLPATPATGDCVVIIPGPGPAGVKLIGGLNPINGLDYVLLVPSQRAKTVVFDGATWRVDYGGY